MVKLRVHVRVISEDAFNEHLDSGRPIPAREEKAFKVIVREPSEWYVGALANEVREKYRSNYKHDLGQIKYLKDSEDADLDPEYFVSDVLVDEGKAAQDGLDQQVTIKVIREQGRGVRMGSVVPDLTPLHYKPPSQNVPPVPKFNDPPSSLGKRKPDEVQQPQVNGLPQINGLGPAKRQRLGQIEEEEDERVHRSIEGSIESGTHDVVIQDSQLSPASERRMFNRAAVKLESPQLGYDFSNLGPTSADEVEFLPNGPTTVRQSSAAREHITTDKAAGMLSPHQQGRPITPVSDRQGRTTPRATVSILNNMKSTSPNPRRQGSASAKKFTRLVRDVYAPPESDIDDSQMSPNSREARRIQPTLVPSVRAVESTESTERMEVDKEILRSDVADLPVNRSEPDIRPQILQNSKEKMPSKVASDAISSADGDHRSQRRKASNGRARKKKKAEAAKLSQNEPESSSTTAQQTEITTTETPRPALAKQSKSFPTEDKLLTPSPDRDSPGMQLSESLHRCTPAVKKAKSIQFEEPADTANANGAANPVESSEDSDTTPPPAEKTPSNVGVFKAVAKGSTKTPQDPGSAKHAELRCYTCWMRPAKCDNAKPKCATCARNKKNCQEYGLTRKEAEKKKAEKGQRESSTPVPTQLKSNVPEDPKATEKTSTKKSKKATKDATSSELTVTKPDTSTQPLQPVTHAHPPRETPAKSNKLKSPEKTAQLENPTSDNALPAPKSYARILPSGMTASEHEAMMEKNAGMTEEMRKLKKISSRAAPRRSVTHNSSGDDEPAPEKPADQKKKKAAEPKSTAKPQESRPKSTSAATESTEPSPAPEPPKNSFLSINVPKPQTQTTRVNGANAPFRSHNKKVAEAVRPVVSSGTSTPTLTSSRSIKDLKKTLAENRKLEAAASSTSTPTIVNRAAGPWPSSKAAPGMANSSQKAVFNIDDDEDESETESESESDESNKPTLASVLKKGGLGKDATPNPGQVQTVRGPRKVQAPTVVQDESSSDGDTGTGSESD